MKQFCVLFLLLVNALLPASIHRHLQIQSSHIPVNNREIDAAFVIRLQDHKDISPLISSFENYNIPLYEYTTFSTLPMEAMTEFCSSIVSPYLLTQILSHLSIYKYCLEKGLDRVLILEDHAQIAENPEKLDQMLLDLAKRKIAWDIFYTDIDFHHEKTGEWIVPRLAEIPRNKKRINRDLSKVLIRYGTASFVISKQGMEKILDYFENHWDNLPYDQVLFKIPRLEIYGANTDVITNAHSVDGGNEKVERPRQQEISDWKIGEEYWIHPTKLLARDRFDIVPKYIFAKYTLGNYQTNWHIDLYHSHLEKWVKCYNTKPLKIGFDDFLSSFHSLIKSMKTKGFDEDYAIGMNSQHVPWNGAHRIGTSIAMDIPVKVKAIEARPSQDLTARVFQETYHLEEKYLDHMTSEYAKLNDRTLVACLYPVAYDHREKVEEVLEKHGKIVRKKEIWLTESGALEFIRLVYTGEWWTGSHLDNYKHSRGKVLLTFPEAVRTKYPVTVYLYECDGKRAATMAKEEFREHCQMGNEVIHINDTHEQTKIIASSLFNQNSIDFLNHRKLLHCANFEKLFTSFRQYVKSKNLDQEELCIDTSAVMSAYGLRDCQDLDILHRNPLPEDVKEYNFDSHNRYLHLHSKGVDEILFNPENHFYYQGIKFLHPKLLKEMKERRGSEKDRRDIEDIFKLLSSPDAKIFS